MMRFLEVLFLAALAVSPVACGGDPEPAADVGAATDGARAARPVKEPAAPPVEPAPTAPARTVLVGQGRVAGDAGPAQEVTLQLSYGDDKVVVGTLTLGDTARAVGGVVDGDRLRCWLRGGDEGGDVQRGMLVGDAQPTGGFSGTFAVSTDGAAAALNGTWEAAPK